MSEEATRVTAGILAKDRASFSIGDRPGDRLPSFWKLPGGKVELGENPRGVLGSRAGRGVRHRCATIGGLFAESTYRYPYATIHLLAFRVDSWGVILNCMSATSCVWYAPTGWRN